MVIWITVRSGNNIKPRFFSNIQITHEYIHSMLLAVLLCLFKGNCDEGVTINFLRKCLEYHCLNGRIIDNNKSFLLWCACQNNNSLKNRTDAFSLAVFLNVSSRTTYNIDGVGGGTAR